MGVDIFDAYNNYEVPIWQTLTFIILILMFVFYIVWALMKTAQKEKENKIKFSIKNYKHLLNKKNFSVEEKNLIEEICNKYGLKAKDSFLLDRSVFNSLTSKYLSEVIPTLSKDKRDIVYRFIHNIRKTINFDKPKTGTSLQSTHEIEFHQPVTIHLKKEKYEGELLENIEPYFVVSMPKKQEIIPEKSSVQVSFLRPKDGYYDVKTRVLKSIAEPNYVYCIKHVNNIHLTYHREYLRIDTEIPCRFKSVKKSFIISEDSSKMKKGKGVITNISGGGLSFYSSNQLVKDTYLSISFKINYELMVKNIKALIVYIDNKKEQGYTYHISFVGISDKLQNKINKYVNNVYHLKKITV